MVKLGWMSGCQSISLGIPRVLETFSKVSWEEGGGKEGNPSK